MTKGNKDKRYVGRTEEGLLPEMKDKLSFQSANLEAPGIQMVYASPMKRCTETAELIFRETPIITVPELRECDFGDFEYRNYQELKDSAVYQEWVDSGGVLPFPNGESRDTFIKRCNKGFQYVLRHAEEHQFHTIAMVVHGGTIMSVFDTYSYPHQDYFTWQTANGEGFETIVNIGVPGSSNEGITLGIVRKCSFIKENWK